MRKISPHWHILIALVLATFTAIALRGLFGNSTAGSSPPAFVSGVLGTCLFIGDLFMRALKMIIVPLIVTAVIAGICGMRGVEGFGRLGLKTVAFYTCSSLVAVTIGLVVVNLIKPGLRDGRPNDSIRAAFSQKESAASQAEKLTVEQANTREGKDFLGIFKAMVPENVIAAASNNGQLLGVIVFSILFAIAATQLPGESGESIRSFAIAANEAMIVVTGWVMALAPIGVFALILPVVYETGADLFTQLGKYFFAVLLALSIHLFVVLPLAIHFFGKTNPLAHFRAMRPALLLGFSTASSSATLPVTMRCVQSGSGVSKRVASFTLPLGATVNMDGTALYECIAVIFVAQVMGIGLGLGEQFFIVVAALLTSVGVAGVPSASLVAILLILKNSGIPNAETAVVALLSVDRLLDMSRTAVNIFSDSCAALIIGKSEEVGPNDTGSRGAHSL